ncbi:hypothetical protein GCM10023116_01730 [Kistimonas scapharcae]|uniref:Uncharacterized protein n=1 Tax=Kistimonas scapharcae TaxID=1036133 RepID=A0ABP8UWI4_9GAMM
MGVENEELHADVFVGADDTPEYTDEELTLPEKTFSDDEPADESGNDGGGDSHEEPAGSEETGDKPADDKPEDEADPTPAEEAGESEEAEPEAAPKKPITIPKERLDRELNRNRNLQKQLDEMKAQLEQQQATPEKQATPEAPQLDIPDPKAMMDAFMAGDGDKFNEMYTKSMQAVAAAARDQALAQTKEAAPSVYTEQQRQQRFQQAAAEVEDAYPFLKEGEDGFDADLVDTVNTFTDRYIQSGYEPDDALRAATDKVLRIEKPELFVEKPAPQPEKQQQVREQRMNIDKKIAAAEAQGPAVEKGQIESPPPLDFANMSEDEFDQLSDKQLDDYFAWSRKQKGL